MLDRDFIDNIVKRLADAVPPGLQAVKADLERNFRSVLQSTFAKLDLVTREEFDVQAGVLAKTRAKLEALEQQIAELEAKLLDKPTDNQ
jgi:BMFP domain-containing protein YqiC